MEEIYREFKESIDNAKEKFTYYRNAIMNNNIGVENALSEMEKSLFTNGIMEKAQNTSKIYISQQDEYLKLFVYDMLEEMQNNKLMPNIPLSWYGSAHFLTIKNKNEDNINNYFSIGNYLKDKKISDYIIKNPIKTIGKDYEKFDEILLEHYSNVLEIPYLELENSIELNTRLKSNSNSLKSKFVEYVIGKEDKFPCDVGATRFIVTKYEDLYKIDDVLKKIIPNEKFIRSEYKEIPEIYDYDELNMIMRKASNLSARLTEQDSGPTREQAQKMMPGINNQFFYKGFPIETQIIPRFTHNSGTFGPANHIEYKKIKQENLKKFIKEYEKLLEFCNEFVRNIFEPYLKETLNINLR